LNELTGQMNEPAFWNDTKRSEDVTREVSGIRTRLATIAQIEQLLDDSAEIVELARAEGDAAVMEDIDRDLARASGLVDGQEIITLFSGPDDTRNAILSIHPGAGGTESMDWAAMLLRMYTRYAEKHGFSLRELDVMPGEEAGIKSASLEIQGDYAFGLLKAESGVHRLVRISPFDASGRRHTSFASVFVYPEVDDTAAIDVRDDDLQIDTYRASGAGGQHVNKTDSAVRITHKPSGIVVQCQSERSQHRNRDSAMKILMARLYALKIEEERKKRDALLSKQKDIAWGSQIRSYVIHPYTMVKDHRTDEQTSDVHRVLDGGIDAFIEAYLHRFAG